MRAAQDAVGVFRALPRTKGPAGATQATTYADDTTAALALWDDRLAWRVTYRAASDAIWDVIVDADSGAVLKRNNMVKARGGLGEPSGNGARRRRRRPT